MKKKESQHHLNNIIFWNYITVILLSSNFSFYVQEQREGEKLTSEKQLIFYYIHVFNCYYFSRSKMKRGRVRNSRSASWNFYWSRVVFNFFFYTIVSSDLSLWNERRTWSNYIPKRWRKERLRDSNIFFMFLFFVQTDSSTSWTFPQLDLFCQCWVLGWLWNSFSSSSRVPFANFSITHQRQCCGDLKS